MKWILYVLLSLFVTVSSLSAEELLKNGDFETGTITGWKYWETFPWDGDGAPVESPSHVTITVTDETDPEFAPSINGFFVLKQQVDSYGTARGGLYQEVEVIPNAPYLLTGYIAFYGDDAGDATIAGVLDGHWNPALALATENKYCINGRTAIPWMEFSITIIPAKNIITVFTETRQDWIHKTVKGWYDNLSLRPIHEPPGLSSSQQEENREEKK